MAVPQMTLPTLKVLGVLLADVEREQYGLELAEAAGLLSGTIYPILARLEHAGWLTSNWENVNESVEGRRRRRYYRLTGVGVHVARQAFANLPQPVAKPKIAPA